MSKATNEESVDETVGDSGIASSLPRSGSTVVRWGPAVLIAVITLGIGGFELLIFPPIPGVGAEVFEESLIIPLLIGGLILVVRADFDPLVMRLLYASMFILLLHAVTEAADELVRPPMAFTFVFEHVGLIIVLGLLLGALWMWLESRQEREEEAWDGHIGIQVFRRNAEDLRVLSADANYSWGELRGECRSESTRPLIKHREQIPLQRAHNARMNKDYNQRWMSETVSRS